MDGGGPGCAFSVPPQSLGRDGTRAAAEVFMLPLASGHAVFKRYASSRRETSAWRSRLAATAGERGGERRDRLGPCSRRIGGGELARSAAGGLSPGVVLGHLD